MEEEKLAQPTEEQLKDISDKVEKLYGDICAMNKAIEEIVKGQKEINKLLDSIEKKC